MEDTISAPPSTSDYVTDKLGVDTTPKVESTVDTLRKAADYMEQHVKDVLDRRTKEGPLKDGEAQKDHLSAVEDNIRNILREEQGFPINAEQEQMIRLFQYGHDRGKWEIARVEELLQPDKQDEIFAKLSMNEAEQALVKRALQDKSPVYSFPKDLVHHLYSAALLSSEMDPGGPLADIPDKHKVDLLNAVLGHQFAGPYYVDGATNAKYTQLEIDTVSRPRLASNTAFGRSCHDGDKLSMAQVGSLRPDGNFALGGFGKLAMINAGSLKARRLPEGSTGEICFTSPLKSVTAVGNELLTQKGKELFGPTRALTQRLTDTFLSSESSYQKLMQKMQLGLTDDTYNQFELALRVESEKIIREAAF